MSTRARRTVIVLGGGLHADGTSPRWALARAEHAARLWATGGVDRVVTSGRGPVPRLRTEARALAEVLAARGVPRGRIVEETAASSTIGNAYYCRSITGPAAEITVVTSKFHASRAACAFGLVFGRPVAVSAADDDGIDPAVLAVLAELDEIQHRFLHAVLAARIAPGDLAAVHSYLQNPASASARRWRSYRDDHPRYQLARAELAALMREPRPEQDRYGCAPVAVSG